MEGADAKAVRRLISRGSERRKALASDRIKGKGSALDVGADPSEVSKNAIRELPPHASYATFARNEGKPKLSFVNHFVTYVPKMVNRRKVKSAQLLAQFKWGCRGLCRVKGQIVAPVRNYVWGVSRNSFSSIRPRKKKERASEMAVRRKSQVKPRAKPSVFTSHINGLNLLIAFNFRR